MAFLNRGDAQINYSDTGVPAGKPDAPTIVFGHGLLFSGWLFHNQIEALRDAYRCVAIDWRGQGASNAPAGEYDMDTLTEDAVALINELGVDKVHYVGLSMGGFVGMRIAARHPELLRSLTLLDTSAMPEDKENVSSYRTLARAYRIIGIKPIAKKVYPIMFGSKSLSDPAMKPVVAEWISQLSRVNRSGMVKAIYGVVDRKGVEDELSNIKTPTLVVVGAEDAATPVHKSQAIAGRIGGARFEVVADAGHPSTMEKLAEITKLIRDFVSVN